MACGGEKADKEALLQGLGGVEGDGEGGVGENMAIGIHGGDVKRWCAVFLDEGYRFLVHL